MRICAKIINCLTLTIINVNSLVYAGIATASIVVIGGIAVSGYYIWKHRDTYFSKSVLEFLSFKK